MGMYADVCGRSVKFSGLVATAIVEVVQQGSSPMKGVDYNSESGCVCGGVIVLDEDDVRAVAFAMREHLLDGHARSCNSWSPANVPLCNAQDIMRFASDVQAFEQFSIWLLYSYQRSDGDDTPTEIVFS